MEPTAVRKFREYIRIRTVHPKPDYVTAVKFLDEYGRSLGLDVKHVEGFSKEYITVLMTWRGKDSSLPSILLNSHTDVVPVREECWTYDPFAAVKTDNGDIYGRGTQDMKSVGIQYLEAIRKLKKEGVQFDRDIHISFVPDEEVEGGKGFAAFMKTEEFKNLNIGFALDEGMASPDNCYVAYHGECTPWWLRIVCRGDSGHGSLFVENTAAEKMQKVINRLLDYRRNQKEKMETSCLPLGAVTTINLTHVEGGIGLNVIPPEIQATFDVRIPLSVDLQGFEEKLSNWCKEAGENITMEFIHKFDHVPITVTDKSNPWWVAFSEAVKKLEIEVKVEVFPASTDGWYLRKAGYKVIGFSPMRNTPVLLHDHNEFLNEKVFMEGIDAYCAIIPALANMKE